MLVELQDPEMTSDGPDYSIFSGLVSIACYSCWILLALLVVLALR